MRRKRTRNVLLWFFCLSKLQDLYIRKEHQGLFHKLALPVPWCLLKQTLGCGAENPEPKRHSKSHQASCCCHCQFPNRNIRWTLLAVFCVHCMVAFLTIGAQRPAVAIFASDIARRQVAPIAMASIATFRNLPLEVRLEAGTRGRPVVQMSNVKENSDKHVYSIHNKYYYSMTDCETSFFVFVYHYYCMYLIVLYCNNFIQSTKFKQTAWLVRFVRTHFTTLNVSQCTFNGLFLRWSRLPFFAAAACVDWLGAVQALHAVDSGTCETFCALT